ncbi:hypothetical protein [Paraburkholderia sp. UYCP14C]|uniref:hypothetical protein n=1 Tax=Paraburkholderia sp. UYCP14C TaxID=2511130 RepID=UPI001459FC3B|nr:hypothetical protein [Paraburkholderia sp. UYCP14C]
MNQVARVTVAGAKRDNFFVGHGQLLLGDTKVRGAKKVNEQHWPNRGTLCPAEPGGFKLKTIGRDYLSNR